MDYQELISIIFGRLPISHATVGQARVLQDAEHLTSCRSLQDLVCICVDVGGAAGDSAPAWLDVLQRVVAGRCINDKAHLEVSIIVYGSNATQNYLDSDSTYEGIDVVCVRPRCGPCIMDFPPHWALTHHCQPSAPAAEPQPQAWPMQALLSDEHYVPQ